MKVDGTYSFSCNRELGSAAAPPGPYTLFKLYSPYMSISSASVSSPGGITCTPDGSAYQTFPCAGSGPIHAGTTVAGSVFQAGSPFCDASDDAPVILAFWPGNTVHEYAGALRCSTVTNPDTGDDESEAGDFKLGKVQRNKKKGTALLSVQAFAGKLALAGKGVVKRQMVVASPGTVELPVKARGKALRKLKTKGKVKVQAEVTMTVQLGSQSRELTDTRKIALVKERQQR